MKLITALTPVLALIACSWVEAADATKWTVSHQEKAPSLKVIEDDNVKGVSGSFSEYSSAPSVSRSWYSNNCPTPKCCLPTCGLLPEYPPPRFYTRLRGLALMRSDDGYVPFAAYVTPPPTRRIQTVLDSDDVAIPFEAGGEVFVGLRLFRNHNLEFTWFTNNTSDQRATVRDSTPNAEGGNGNLFSPIGKFRLTPLDQYDYNNFASVHYKTQLSNYELNLRKMLPMPPGRLRSSFLVGIRSNQIDEYLSYHTTSDIPALGGTENLIHTKAYNSLIGAQIGGLFELHVEPRWWINCEVEAAICQNQVSLESAYTQTSGVGGTTNHIHSHSQDNTSFVGELVLSLVYECGENLTTEVGYRAIWITGLALATENLQTNPDLLVLGPPSLNDKGDVIYHGPHLGVTLRW